MSIINKPNFINISLVFFSGLLLISAVFLSVKGKRAFSYITISLLTSVLIILLNNTPDNPVSVSDSVNRLIECFSYLSICLVIYLSYTTPTGVPIHFYTTTFFSVLFITFTIVFNSRLRHIIPIILLAVSIRSSYWNVAPVIGRDVRAHISYSTYIVETGEVIPEAVSYYRFYPIGHIFSAIMKEVTGLVVRSSFFISIGLGSSFSIIIIVILIRRYFSVPDPIHQRTYLLAAVFLTIAPFHVQISSSLIVQSLMILFIPISLFMFIDSDKRIRSLALFSMGVLLIVHNAPVLGLLGLGTIIISLNKIITESNLNAIAHYGSNNMIAIMLLALIQYWVLTDLFELQISRLLRLASPGGSLSEAAQSVGTQTVNTISLVDPLLHVAIGLLIAGTCLVALTGTVLVNIIDEKKTFPVDYLLSSLVVTGGFGIALFIGLDTNIIRLVALVPIFASPVIGYVLANVSLRGRLGCCTVVLLLLIIPGLFIISASGPGWGPGTAVTEDRPGLHRIYLSDSEISGAEAASNMTSELTASNYVASTLSLQPPNYGRFSNTNGVNVMNGEWPEETCRTNFFVRDYYHTEFRLPHSEKHRVLDVGDAYLVEC